MSGFLPELQHDIDHLKDQTQMLIDALSIARLQNQTNEKQIAKLEEELVALKEEYYDNRMEMWNEIKDLRALLPRKRMKVEK